MNKHKQKGITLVEILVAVSIFVAIVIVFVSFQSDVFKLNRIISSGLNTQQYSTKILRPFASEIRSATISNIGAFPISVASSTIIEFYSDTDDDGLAEKIKYFVEDNKFKRSSIIPSGNPLIYDSDDATVKTVVDGVVNGATSVFEYFDESYDGSSTSTPMGYPINLTNITLVKATLILDDNPNALPLPVTVTSQVMFRNLKDN